MRPSRRLATVLAAVPLAALAVVAPAQASTIGTTEGCTPGYWKNHTSAWMEDATLRIPSSTRLDTARGSVGQTLFTATATTGYGSTTMLEALSLKGGSGVDGAERTLLRAATASWLNAAHEEIHFPLRRVIRGKGKGLVAHVNAALLSQDRQAMLDLADELDRVNNLGCPL